MTHATVIMRAADVLSMNGRRNHQRFDRLGIMDHPQMDGNCCLFQCCRHLRLHALPTASGLHRGFKRTLSDLHASSTLAAYNRRWLERL